MSEMITADLVDLDLSADTREAATRALAERMAALGRVTDLDGFLADVAAREARMPTGLEGGIGIPHCRSAHVTEPTLAFGRATPGVDFGAPDGPADLIFLIAAPTGADDAHLSILSSLARRLMESEFTTSLRSGRSAESMAALLRGEGAADTESGPEAVADAAGPDAAAGGVDAADAVGGAGGVGLPESGGTAGGTTGTAETAEMTASTGAAGTTASTGAAGTTASTDAAGTTASTGAAQMTAAASDAEPAGGESVPFRIVAVTSCPTGIAHTYMAAESLERAARAEGVEIDVETQGSAGFQRLDPGVIAAADAVIFAHDVPVRAKERFAGKPVVDVGVKAGINRPAQLLAEARQKAQHAESGTGAFPSEPADATARSTAGGPRRPLPLRAHAAEGAAAGGGAAGEAGAGSGAAAARAAGGSGGGATGESAATRLRTWLMTGVSYMVPFVAAGGLLIALAFAIGGYQVDKAPSVAEHFLWTEAASWAALLFQIGGTAFEFLVPVLAGYIAYGMADRPGLVPGFVGGAVALTINAGFLGGLIAGLLAGAVVMAVQRVDVPAALRGIMPVVVLPLVSSAVVGFLMFLVVGKPVAALQKGLTDWLSGLSGANAVVLGAVLGLMMCFDLGGPLNKVAYAFAIGGLTHPNDGSLKVMAAVMAAGMVPPLAMAVATTVRGSLFTKAERENGKAAWVLGASFITEGAIPFAAADPMRVIPSAMAGGAVTGALSMAFGCTLRAPHGGAFVVPLIGSPLLYVLAVVAGTGVSAALVVLLKSTRRTADGSAGHGAAAPAAETPEVAVPA
ncbi:fructose-specific PTS transporter subunit EIIC [Streptomyces sp. NPDC002055]|uniref:PTS fructose transporter subunit IIABC n=1 Tax=Streptomyces sp. NPDC002055 TaxID=3154534 RepID=UPI0033313BBE